jgi:hypothetical protein
MTPLASVLLDIRKSDASRRLPGINTKRQIVQTSFAEKLAHIAAKNLTTNLKWIPSFFFLAAVIDSVLQECA